MSGPENINVFSLHLWIALRNSKLERSNWPSIVAGWLRVTETRAKALLGGSTPNESEFKQASRQLNLEMTELMFSQPTLNADEVLRDNIDFLLTEGFSSAKAAARELDLSEESVSRWRNGRHKPRAEHVRKLAEAAGIDPSINLSKVPLCLLGGPLSSTAKRKWLLAKIEGLDGDSIDLLFPAMERMFRT